MGVRWGSYTQVVAINLICGEDNHIAGSDRWEPQPTKRQSSEVGHNVRNRLNTSEFGSRELMLHGSQ